jgi:hypothetical protein
LRAGRDGTVDKVVTELPPIYILGGDHADLPLEPGSGSTIADIVVDEHLSVILDLSAMEQEDQAVFAAAFARQLYIRNRDPLHLIVDEADIFAAEQPGSSNEFECRRALDTIVRRGRVRGLGVTLLSQRPAVVAKNLVTQTGTLIVHRTASPQDQKAIDAWFKAHGGDQQRRLVMASLASLPVGEAWVWSPSDLQPFEKIQIRPRRTYDSSATPVVGAKRQPPPQRLAVVDLEGLRERLTTAIKLSEENDPQRLRVRIADLERQLRERPVEKVVEEKIVERSVLSEEALAQLREAMSTAATLGKELGTFHALLAGLVNSHRKQTQGFGEDHEGLATSEKQTGNRRIARRGTTHQLSSTPQTQRLLPSLHSEPDQANISAFSRGECRILEALARYPGQRMSVAQLGTFTKLTPSGGTWAQYMKNLRANGLIREVEGGLLEISEIGLHLLGASIPSQPQSAKELLALWRPALRTREFEMLDYLVSIRPKTVTLNDLARHFGLTANAGTFAGYVATLRRNKLIEQVARNISASDHIPKD